MEPTQTRTILISHLIPGNPTHIQAIIRGKHGRGGKEVYNDGVKVIYVIK